MRKDLEKLIKSIEKQIVSILIARGLVKSSSSKFSNLELTPEGKAVSGMSDTLVTDEWIQKWRSLWPPGYRGSTPVIRSKISRYMMEHETSLMDITRATELYLSDKKAPYCGKAQFFFYKEDNNKIETSRCEEYVELLQNTTGSEQLESVNNQLFVDEDD